MSGTFLSSVCLRLSHFSFMQYMGLCIFILSIFLMMIVRIRVLYLVIIIKSEVRHICRHCLGLGHETMVCDVCISIYSNADVFQSTKPVMNHLEDIKCGIKTAPFSIRSQYSIVYFLYKVQHHNPDVLVLLRPRGAEAYNLQWTGSSLIQPMAWNLLGAKPSAETMLTYCQLDS